MLGLFSKFRHQHLWEENCDDYGNVVERKCPCGAAQHRLPQDIQNKMFFVAWREGKHPKEKEICGIE